MLYPLTWWLLKLTVNLVVYILLLLAWFFTYCGTAYGVKRLIDSAQDEE
jgi:hypothetical protein